MKKKLMTGMTAFGVLLFLIGAASLDGTDWVTGMAVMAAGMAVAGISSQYIEKDPEDGHPQSQTQK